MYLSLDVSKGRWFNSTHHHQLPGAVLQVLLGVRGADNDVLTGHHLGQAAVGHARPVNMPRQERLQVLDVAAVHALELRRLDNPVAL